MLETLYKGGEMRKLLMLLFVSCFAMAGCGPNAEDGEGPTAGSSSSGEGGSSSGDGGSSSGDVAKIGILHSLSGTMAISETSLRDVVLMAVEEINSAGGVLGKQIEPVAVDPASDWDLFAARQDNCVT